MYRDNMVMFWVGEDFFDQALGPCSLVRQGFCACLNNDFLDYDHVIELYGGFVSSILHI